MSTLAKLLVSLGLDSGDYTKGLADSAQQTDGFAKSLLSIGTVAVAAGAIAGTALLGVGIASVKAFGAFETGMSEVFTLLPGMSQSAMGAMTADVKDFSKEFGVLPEQTIPALYQALSAGVPKDNVFEFLEIAQKAAVGGVTELETAVDGITSVINAYGPSVLGATAASDMMFTTVKLGKTNFEQLSSSLFNVIPTAASLGVSFGDVSAALASLTLQGTPTSVATTQIRSALVEASKGGTKLSDALIALTGKSFPQLVAGGMDIGTIFNTLRTSMPDQQFKDLFGSVEALNAVLGITGPNAANFASNLEAMKGSTGATDLAFQTMNQTLGASVNKLKAFGAVFLIDIGEKLAPAVALFTNSLIGLLNSQAVTDVVNNLGVSIAKTVEWLMTASTTVLPQVIVAFHNLIAIFTTSSASLNQFAPIIDGTIARFQLMVAIVSAVFGILVNVITANSDQIATTLNGTWSTVVSTANSVFTALNGIIMTVLGMILTFLQTNGADIATTFIQWTSQVVSIVGTAMQLISGIVQAVYNIIIGFTNEHGASMQAIWGSVWEIIKNVISGALTIIQGILTAALKIFQGDWAGAWQAIQAMSVSVLGNISGVITSVLNIIAVYFGTTLDKLVALWTNNWNMLVTIASKMGANVIATIAGFVSKAVEVGASIVQGIINGVTNAAGNLYNALKSLASNALAAAKSAIGISSPSTVFASDVGVPIIQGIVLGVSQSAGLLTNAMQTTMGMAVTGAQAVVNKIAGVLTNSQLPMKSTFLGQTMVDNIAKAFEKHTATTMPVVSIAAQSIITNIENTWGKSDITGKAKDIGGNAMKGIISGIEGKLGAAVTKAKEAAQKIVDAMAAKLDIKSPSGVFASQVGIPIVMGIMQGMTDKLPTLLAFIGKTGRKILDETLGVMASLTRSSGIDVFKSLLDLETLDPFQPLVDATEALTSAQQQARSVSENLLDLNAEIAVLQNTPMDQVGDHLKYNEKITALYAKQAILLGEQAQAQANLARLGQTQAEAQAQSAQQQVMINQIADNARKQYETAQQQALGMMQQDAKGALDFFNKRKAQIAELAQLEKDKALATSDQQRADLDTQIRLTQAAQQAEQTQQAVQVYIGQQDQRAMGDVDIIKIIENALRNAGLSVDIRTRTA